MHYKPDCHRDIATEKGPGNPRCRDFRKIFDVFPDKIDDFWPFRQDLPQMPKFSEIFNVFSDKIDTFGPFGKISAI